MAKHTCKSKFFLHIALFSDEHFNRPQLTPKNVIADAFNATVPSPANDDARKQRMAGWLVKWRNEQIANEADRKNNSTDGVRWFRLGL